MLTSRQKEALEFIIKAIEKDGLAPTIAELRQGLGLSSGAAAMRLLESLEERGYIRRLHRRARAIEVLKGAPGEPPGWEIEKRNLLGIIMRQNERLTALGQAPEPMP